MRHPEDPTDATDHDNCNCDQALALIDTVNRLVRERDEARKLAEYLFDAVCDPREREEWLLPWRKKNE